MSELRSVQNAHNAEEKNEGATGASKPTVPSSGSVKASGERTRMALQPVARAHHLLAHADALKLSTLSMYAGERCSTNLKTMGQADPYKNDACITTLTRTLWERVDVDSLPVAQRCRTDSKHKTHVGQ
eukprot:6205680-Pleurochrysis_carterae.AAC.3